MLSDTECTTRFATHARRMKQVNLYEWMRPEAPASSPSVVRARLGNLLIALGSRLSPLPPTGGEDMISAWGRHT
jgi:hypothetical protein